MLWACAPELLDAEAGFRVKGVFPEDGSADATETQTPWIEFSDPYDLDRCGAATRLDAVKTDGTVAFPIGIVPTAGSSARELLLPHDEPLTAGWTYAITVRGGSGGCTDEEGREVEPFASSFVVP